MKSLSRLIGLALLVCVCGCGDDGVDPVGACEDLASAVADVSVRCDGWDKEIAYQSFLDEAEIFSCVNVVAVRDNTALYNDCIPSLSTIECSAFSAGNLSTLSTACDKQLIIER